MGGRVDIGDTSDTSDMADMVDMADFLLPFLRKKKKVGELAGYVHSLRKEVKNLHRAADALHARRDAFEAAQVRPI